MLIGISLFSKVTGNKAKNSRIGSGLMKDKEEEKKKKRKGDHRRTAKGSGSDSMHDDGVGQIVTRLELATRHSVHIVRQSSDSVYSPLPTCSPTTGGC